MVFPLSIPPAFLSKKNNSSEAIDFEKVLEVQQLNTGLCFFRTKSNKDVYLGTTKQLLL